MKIAICDDCSQDIQYLKELIRESPFCPKDTEFLEFSSGEEQLKCPIHFNAIFLDMQMDGINGSETAAHKILNSRPSKYLMKNYDKEKLAGEVELVLREMLYINKMKRIKVQYYGMTVLLRVTDILYISINGKGTQIWVTDEKANELWGVEKMPKLQALRSGNTLKAYYQELGQYGFVYASKSYIVNVRHVMALSSDEITLKGGWRLKLTKGKKKAYEEEFARFWELFYNQRRLWN